MPRRVSVPGSDELFRPTVVPPPAEQPTEGGPRTASGRVKHDEKMTVYLTAEELLAIEHARLQLRGRHGLGVDRGRLVRAAIAMALADLDEHGPDGDLVRRLRGS